MTYCDHIDFPLTSWSDLSDWPQLDQLAKHGTQIIGVNMQMKVKIIAKMKINAKMI